MLPAPLINMPSKLKTSWRFMKSPRLSSPVLFFLPLSRRFLNAIQTAVKKLTGLRPLIVGPGIKTGLNIAVENPGLVGSDIISACVGALSLFAPPLIVLDTGTVITLSVIHAGNRYIGGAFMPGPKLSLDAMRQHSAQLPGIALDHPGRLIGRNTVDCMRSGLMYGLASMIDGMIARMCTELDTTPTVVMTGGFSTLIAPLCQTDILLERDLVMQGLWQIYHQNQK